MEVSSGSIGVRKIITCCKVSKIIIDQKRGKIQELTLAKVGFPPQLLLLCAGDSSLLPSLLFAYI